MRGHVRALELMLSTHATREALGVGQGELLPAALAEAVLNADLYDIIMQHAGAADLFCYVCKIRPAVLAFVEKVSWVCVIRVGGSGVGREKGSNCSRSQGAVGMGKPVEKMWCGRCGDPHEMRAVALLDIVKLHVLADALRKYGGSHVADAGYETNVSAEVIALYLP